jgi:hypothetical protein
MKKLAPFALALVCASAVSFSAVAAEGHGHAAGDHVPQKSPAGAKVYIVNLKDGGTYDKKVKVVFGLSGMGICPAGITASGQPIPDTGHHHLLVDVDQLPPLDQPLPADKPEKILHFGKGQTETTLELAPGKHTLQLLFADYGHFAHQPPVMSEKITITVK